MQSLWYFSLSPFPLSIDPDEPILPHAFDPTEPISLIHRSDGAQFTPTDLMEPIPPTLILLPTDLMDPVTHANPPYLFHGAY